jgi:hypothetical protein
MIDPNAAIAAIIARDRLERLAPEDVDYLVAQYPEQQAQLMQLRTPEVGLAEPAVIFPAE